MIHVNTYPSTNTSRTRFQDQPTLMTTDTTNNPKILPDAPIE